MESPEVAAPPSPPTPSIEAQVGRCVLLSAVAMWLAFWGHWVVFCEYDSLRGRTDLDMPDWFVINLDLTCKVLPLAGLAAGLNLIAAYVYFLWAGRVGWCLRVGFPLFWLGSVAAGLALVLSRLP